MNEIRLSDSQRKIVEANDGSMLVLASAGSGKTRVLTERVRHLLSTKKGTFKILALTFTNKAAEEMRARLKAINEVGERTFIGTIHKFCLEIIRSKGSSIGINEMPHIFEKENDRREMLLQVLGDNPILRQYYLGLAEKDQSNFIFEALNYISQKKKSLFGLENDDEDDDENRLLFNEYNSLLLSQNAIDFDDVICLAYKILIERPKVAELYRKMYKYVCIDESQDLNFAQYEFIKALCVEENKNILMVGDPNQAIYGFNGSDKIYMSERFVKEYDAEIFHLNENYRSSLSVINAANQLIPGSLNISNAIIKGEFGIEELENENEEASWVANKINDFLLKKKHPDIEGDIKSESIAVLARNKYVLKILGIKLSEIGINFFYKKNNESTDAESDIIKLFDLGMRILINPLDKLHLVQICKLAKLNETPVFETTDGLSKLETIYIKVSDPEIKLDFEILISAWNLLNQNVNNFLKSIEAIESYANKLKDHSATQAKSILIFQDTAELKFLWGNYSLQVSVDNKSLANFRNQLALGLGSDSANKNIGVTLGTVHSVKGLEFDIVFIMGMNEGTFPDYRAVKLGGASLTEEKNNAFVALTRSKRLLFITYPRVKFMPWNNEVPVAQRKSRFLSNFS